MVALLFSALGMRPALAQPYQVIRSFGPQFPGALAQAGAALVLDAAANLYGTTQYGGATQYSGGYGYGTVFKLDAAASYTRTTLHAFKLVSGVDGANPLGALVRDSAGNLYGTTQYGGAAASSYVESGTVFKLDASNHYALSLLHSFSGPDGAQPRSALIIDSAANLYGTTIGGGTSGGGTVFKLSASNNYALTTLHSFSGPDGLIPIAGLIMDPAGNLFGATAAGGTSCCDGTVFKLDASNNYALTTLHNFAALDGRVPLGGLASDTAGNLYGTAWYGGANNLGTVFKLDRSSGYALTTLHAFGGPDGALPAAGLVADAAGNLYGTTQEGGPSAYGTVFRLDASNHYALTVLHGFTYFDGALPIATPVLDSAGNLYGTTQNGGPLGHGTVFKLDASSNYVLTTLHLFFEGFDGVGPLGALLEDSVGNLYGTTETGGGANRGTVFKLDAARNYQLTILHSFSGFDGAGPQATLVADSVGNLYGTTFGGGAPGTGTTILGYGTVFRLDASRNYALTTLHRFDVDDRFPTGGLVLDSAGNLYGTTTVDLAFGAPTGTIFKLDAARGYALTRLYAFSGPDGRNPAAPLMMDSAGSLYGTTTLGGAMDSGTVFRLDAARQYAFTSLHSFSGSDGANPAARLIADAAGNLYGTTQRGGAHGVGIVFKLDAANGYALAILHDFAGPDGATPNASLSADSDGNLYGATVNGGAGDGVIFKLDAANNYALTIMHSFNGSDGALPFSAPVVDSVGVLYGTAAAGGANGTGVVFRIAVAPTRARPVPRSHRRTNPQVVVRP